MEPKPKIYQIQPVKWRENPKTLTYTMIFLLTSTKLSWEAEKKHSKVLMNPKTHISHK